MFVPGFGALVRMTGDSGMLLLFATLLLALSMLATLPLLPRI
jgi:hypothetical protein